MDTALELLVKRDRGEVLTEREILDSLNRSVLVKKISTTPISDATSLIWKLIALSEIPFADRLDYTNSLMIQALERMSTPEGFTLSGKSEDLLPCYNAMLIKAFCRLGCHSHEAVENGVRWILRYQSFERNRVSEWGGPGIHRYGGCLERTPCYIGLTKSVYALLEYSHFVSSERISETIRSGLDYILEHNVYRRRSNGDPITAHIMDLAFPESYNTTVVELLLLLLDAGILRDDRVLDSIHYIQGRRNANGKWPVDYVYGGKGYISFDGKSKNAEWISYKLNRVLAAGLGVT